MTINNKQRRDELPGACAQYDADVVVETWELQENKCLSPLELCQYLTVIGGS